MKFGMSVWYGDKPLEKAIERAKRLKFDYVEISLDYPLHPNKRLNELFLKLKKCGLDLAFHLPIPELNLCHPSKDVSTPALILCKKFLSSLASYNPIYVNLHLPAMLITAEFKEIWKVVVKKAEEIAADLYNFSETLNLHLIFENGTYNSIRSRAGDLNFLLRHKFNFCLDIGHMVEVLQHKKINTTKLIKQLEKFKRIISVIHLHDVGIIDGGIRDHLALGSGQLSLNKIFKFIEEVNCKYLLLEIFYSRKKKKVTPAKFKDIKRSLELVREKLD